MDGMIPYNKQLETGYRLRTLKPLDLREESARIDRIKAHAGVEENDLDRCSELMLMAAASYDMDRYFCGDVENGSSAYQTASVHTRSSTSNSTIP